MAKGPPRILIVEDNRDVLEIVSDFLVAYGFETAVAKDGQEGFEQFLSLHPQLVLADVLLPKLNGFKLCQKIKAHERSVPVIMMSALYKTYSLQQEAKTKYGADDYMIKPLNLMDLAKRICQHLCIDRPEKMPKAEEPIQAEATPEFVPEAAPALNESFMNSTGDIPAKGDLADVPVEQLFGWLVHRRLTGKIEIYSDNFKRTVFVKNGIPVYLYSTLPSEQFTQLLLDDGKLTPQQLSEIEIQAKLDKTTPGKLLVEQGLLEKDELSAYLIQEVEMRLEKILGLTYGRYVSIENSSFLEKIKRPELDIFNFVYQAVGRHVSVQRLRARFDRRSHMTVGKNEENLPLAGKFDWDQNHLDAFMLIDSERTVGEIVDNADTVPLAVWQLLYTLEIFGIIYFH